MDNTLRGLKRSIFFDFMINKKGLYPLDYNIRMGNTKVQTVIDLMENHLYEVIEVDINKRLNEI